MEGKESPSEAHRGLDAPQLTNHTPRSLNPCENLQAVTHAKPCQTSALALQGPATVEVPLQFPAVQKRRGMDAVVRTKQASQSPIVRQLWKLLVQQIMSLSTLLQQILSSPNAQLHIDRLLDTFAASTLVKYMNALRQFFQVCMDLRVDLETIAGVQLADVFLACRLSRSTAHGMAHVNVIVKAVRWAYRTLQVDCFSIALGSVISSFHRTEAGDRRESLPFSLFALMHFERRILMRECLDHEVVTLGTFLFLAFSCLRFSDVQRTSPSSLHCNGDTLRGTCWRTKTSRAGQPFGLIGCGFLSKGTFTWLFKFLTVLDQIFALHGDGSEDFIIPGCNRDGVHIPIQPMSYAEALYFVTGE